MNEIHKPIQNSTLVSMVAQELRQRLDKGVWSPGTFLPPRKKLAEEFGVGHSTIQEAIQALTATGLLDSRPGKGTWVRKDISSGIIQPEIMRSRLGDLDVWHLYEARTVVEVALTQFAAERATNEDIAQIWETIKRMELSLDDDQAYAKADMDFHISVAAASHNHLMVEFYYLAVGLLEEYIDKIIRLPAIKENGLAIQQKIALMIENHDVEGARLAAIDHMKIIEKLLHAYDHH